jgi:hypothetical protein
MDEPIHPDDGTPPAVAALRKSLTDLVAESQALRGDVRSAETARRRASQINLGLLGLLILFVGLLVAIGWQGNQAIAASRETNRRIADCSTPGGACYEEGRELTAAAINDILLVSIYMAECARLFPGEAGPEYDRKLEACIYQRLSQPPPSTFPSTVPPAGQAPR